VTATAILDATPAARERVRIAITGTVQGVGFRPFVWRKATALGLAGSVANTAAGVLVEAEGSPAAVASLLRSLREDAPPNARIARCDVAREPPTGAAGFVIAESVASGARRGAILPDLATCPECLAEIADPASRRYRYPFTNCTHCGPRYSIVRDMPYDRARTSMAVFPMCADCRAEYDNPADRRFHAEAIACPACGPRLALWDAAGRTIAAADDALLAAGAALRDGRVVAVKGIGGFHLMVDARNPAAVARLRRRKHRPDKPLAVMFPSLEALAPYANVDPAEAALLSGRERPIVLLRQGRRALADAVAPGGALIGAMLPYSPLHHLLLGDVGFPVVATSGNLSDEPIVTDEADALVRLGEIADCYLVHDRPIVRPLDDSVVRVIAGTPTVFRRARGYAPAPVEAGLTPGILALGGHLKAAVALTTESGAVVSQHLGDLDTPQGRDAYHAAVADLTRLYRTEPRAVVRDLHPDYYSSRVAAAHSAPVISVQHHVAHVAAVMAEHDLVAPLLGIAWDGTGDGGDGTIWGGEFIRITPSGWERVAHLLPFRLPGGEAAVREPRRSALGLLRATFGDAAFAMDDLAPVAGFTAAERRTIAAMIARGVGAPVTTSAGRLFDGVAALVGLSQRATYEAQAASALETAADACAADVVPYPFPVTADAPMMLDWRPAIRSLVTDVRTARPVSEVAAAFHGGLARAIVEVASRAGEATVVLAGGCFQNARLAAESERLLEAAGRRVFRAHLVPPNDGGLSLGQAWWAAKMECV